MGVLRVICCLLILYSVITLFITTENIIEDNHLYLMLKHSIMVVLSIILFAYSFSSKFNIPNNTQIINYIFLDIIFIDLVFHIYCGYRHISIKRPEIYDELSILILLPLLFTTSNVTIACISTSLIYLLVSIGLVVISKQLHNLFNVLIRVFGSTILLVLLIIAIINPTFILSTEILFAYRTIQILHIVISVWVILNECHRDEASGCREYHLFNLLYGIIKLTISFL